MTEAVIIYKPDWFLYDNGRRHERVNNSLRHYVMFFVTDETCYDNPQQISSVLNLQ